MEQMIQQAYELAQKAHAGQVDKLGKPYLSHPEAVAEILQTSPAFLNLPNSLKTNAIIVALLHDTIEDTFVDEDYLLAEGFSPEVVHSVKLLTFNKNLTRIEYYNQILTDEIARCVKVADVSHNCMKSRLENLSTEQQDKLINKYTTTVSYILKLAELEWFKKQTDNSLNLDTL